MESDVLSLEQACTLLGVGAKTMIRMLGQEHMPARKIGREWRLSRAALLEWLASGDSTSYTSVEPDETFIAFEDRSGASDPLLAAIEQGVARLRETNDVRSILPSLDRSIELPGDASLYVNYKQKRGYEKVQFEIYWELRSEVAAERQADSANRKV